MSDRMHPIPFEALLDWVFGELSAEQTIFGVRRFYRAPEGAGLPWMGRKPETAVGTAAGPHTQLAQNIAAGYVCGARVFELKTVQILDGENLVVSKPCISAADEGYNCEWSTELTVEQARDEYIKAWFLLHVLAKELELGGQDGFAFNMSVGYDLAGIQSPKVDGFLNDLKNAVNTDQFRRCREILERRLDRFQRFSREDLEAISPDICSSVTISTMHGCPPAETERIATYLLEEKRLNLLLKCNPTLVGYDYARRTLDERGFTYIRLDREAFENDLQYADAVPMLERLREKARELGLYFGVKLTNTLHVKGDGATLPDENIYMSGRTLLPLSLKVAADLSRDFNGTLPMSYCGGADGKNIAALRGAGLCPITVCTDLLKPAGYAKLNAMAKALEGTESAGTATDSDALDRLCATLGGNAKPAGESTPRKLRPDAPKPKLECLKVCGACASVCPNRANVIVRVNGEKRMLHIDALCNECGNCASFCAEKCAPYLERMTLFDSPEALEDSRNRGFAYMRDAGRFLLRWDGECRAVDADDAGVPEDVRAVMRAVRDNYPWLLYGSEE